jgi:hypothetical protein
VFTFTFCLFVLSLDVVTENVANFPTNFKSRLCLRDPSPCPESNIFRAIRMIQETLVLNVRYKKKTIHHYKSLRVYIMPSVNWKVTKAMPSTP